MQSKPSIRELIIIAAIILSAVTVFIISTALKSDGKTAVISVAGRVSAEINLNAEDKTFSLDSIENITFERKDNRIRIISSDCPDKICKKTGFISDCGETIVCMPNKIIVEIKD